MSIKEIREQWWVDLIEGEMDKGTEPLYRLLLKYSPTDKEIVSNLSRTRDLLKQAHPPLPTLSEDYFTKLKAKIMLAVEKCEIESQPTEASHRPWYKTGVFRTGRTT